MVLSPGVDATIVLPLLGPLRRNVTLSTKLEVHNVSQCCREGQAVDIGSMCRKIGEVWTYHDSVKKCMEYKVEGARPRGRPKKTRREIVEKDCQTQGLNREDATDRSRWRKQIRND